MDNYDLNEGQYAQINQKFDITGKKAAMNQKVTQMTAANSGNTPAPFPGSQSPVEQIGVDFAPVGRAGQNEVNVQSGGGLALPNNASNVVGAPVTN